MAGVLFLSPLAMAGDLGSADSDFLFSSEQVAATTISSGEMQGTAGRLQEFVFDVDGFEVVIVLPEGFTPNCVGSLNDIADPGSIFNACPTEPNNLPVGGFFIVINR